MERNKGLNWTHLRGESSCIDKFTYDYRSKTLYVVFRGGRKNQVYKYEGVGRQRYNGLRLAESKGKYFNAAFRGRVGKAL